MSLLMEALKKAEQAKRQNQAERDAPPASEPALELAPLDAAWQEAAPPSAPPSLDGAFAAPSNPLPQLDRLELLDREFLDHVPPAPQPPSPRTEPPLQPPPSLTPPPQAPSPRPPPPQTAPRERAVEAPKAPEQAQIHNLFEAKQAPANSKKHFIIAVSLFTLISIAGIGIYFWMQLNPGKGLGLKASPAPSAATGGSATLNPASMGQTPTPPIQNMAPPAAEPEPLPEKPATTAPLSRIEPQAPPARETQQRPASPIRITTTKPVLDPALTKAYEAFQQGDLKTAQAAYESALKNDPMNPDALHGMAAIHLRQGQHSQAEAYYQQAIEADPRDLRAHSNLLALRSQADSVQTESRLKNLLASDPESPPLYFSLGNIYASQGRWNEAQQAYFKAMSGDNDNPDYLFNLAISLDRLNQPKLAAQYYGQALTAAERRPAVFDKAIAENRRKKLHP